MGNGREKRGGRFGGREIGRVENGWRRGRIKRAVPWEGARSNSPAHVCVA